MTKRLQDYDCFGPRRIDLDLARHDAVGGVTEEYHEIGYNFRLTDMQAAVGVVQMGKLATILELRRCLAERYTTILDEMKGVEPPLEPAGWRDTYQSYCVRLTADKPRAEIIAAMAAKEIATRPGVMAIHLEPAYRKLLPRVLLPNTEEAAAKTMLLPLYAEMTLAEQDTVIEALSEALA